MSDAHAHDHDHPPFLQHHWENPKQQFEAGKLGMWLFLATEVLLFGGLFCGYAIWRANHPEMFKFGSTFLDTTMGAINTAVLIASSLTMAAAVTMIQKGNRQATIILIVLTLGGALGFLTIKYFEYSHKFHEGWFPGARFYEKPGELSHTWKDELTLATGQLTTVDTAERAPTVDDIGLPEDIPVEVSTVGPAESAPSGLDVAALDEAERKFVGVETEEVEDELMHPLQNAERPENAHMFFNIYFMMTGLHGVHVLVGGMMLVWLLVGTIQGKYGAEYFTPIDLGGLYWHVVDLIWIFLFPLFYLI